MPEHRAFQILGSLIHVLVERDLVDPTLPLVSHDVAEGLGDGDLLLVADLQAAKEDHSTLLQRCSDIRRLAATEERVEIGPDLAADSCCAVDDFELLRRKLHARQRSLVRIMFAECFTLGCLHSSTANETVINEYSRLRRFATSSGSGSEKSNLSI